MERCDTPHRLRASSQRVYRLDCGCGFAVEGDEDEVVDAARRHAEHVHGLQLVDGIVRALARPLPDRRLRSADRTQDQTKGM